MDGPETPSAMSSSSSSSSSSNATIMLSDQAVQIYLLVLGWSIWGCLRAHYHRTCHNRHRRRRSSSSPKAAPLVNRSYRTRRHLPPILSLLILSVTWFLIFRFILANLRTSESYFDDAYKDVLRTPSHYATSAQLLTWAAVAVVWSAGDEECDGRVLVFGFLGAMGASFSLWVPSAVSDGGAVASGGGRTGSGRITRRSREERRSVPISYALCSAFALLCVTRLRPCDRSVDTNCTGDEGFGSFLPNFRQWLQALHIVLILPLLVSRVLWRPPSQPTVDASVLYLALFLATWGWHLAQGGKFAWPTTDCQISIFVDLVSCTGLTVYAVYRDSYRCALSTGYSHSSRSPGVSSKGENGEESTAAAEALATERAAEVANATALRNAVAAAALVPILSPAAVLAGHLFLLRFGPARDKAVRMAQRYMAGRMRKSHPGSVDGRGKASSGGSKGGDEEGWCNLGLWIDGHDSKDDDGDDSKARANGHKAGTDGATAATNGAGEANGTAPKKVSSSRSRGYDEACRNLALLLGRSASLDSSSSVLCCGCGSRSELLLYLREFGPRRVTGIDPGLDEMEESRVVLHDDDDEKAGDSGNGGDGGDENGTSRKKEELWRVRRVRAGVEDLRPSSCSSDDHDDDDAPPLFPPRIFDRILALDNAYHYPNKTRFLRDCAAMLPEGGKLGVTDLLIASDSDRAGGGGGRLPWTVRMALNLMGVRVDDVWTEADYRRQLIDAGFIDVQIRSIGNGVFAGWRDVLPSFLLRHLDYAVVVATKPTSKTAEKPPTRISKKKKVAIVGSGLAGLSAAHRLLSSSYAADLEVTVYESRTKPGLAAHTFQIGSQLVDVPARMAARGYYSTYVRLLDELGLPCRVVRTDCTYYGEDGRNEGGREGGKVAYGYGRSSWENLRAALTAPGGVRKLAGMIRAVSSIDDDVDDTGGSCAAARDDPRADILPNDDGAGNDGSSLGNGAQKKRTPPTAASPPATFGDWIRTHFSTDPHAMTISRHGNSSSNGKSSQNGGNQNGSSSRHCQHYSSDLPALTCRDDPFLYVLIGSVCWMLSCTYDHLINYPADVILPYIRDLNMSRLGLFRDGQVVRVDPSIKSLERALLHGVDRLRCGSRARVVAAPVPTGGAEGGWVGDREGRGLLVIEGDDGDGGEADRYDAVIVATEASAVSNVLGEGLSCSSAFGDVRYHPSSVYLHTDPRMMPPDRNDWRTWNVEQRPGRDCPQLTFWLNEFYPDAKFEEDTFQTWAPLRDVQPDAIVQRSDFQRVVHTARTAELVRRIEAEQGKGGVYYAGSYCVYGMGLLEEALKSGMDAGDAVLRDWFQET